VHGDGAGVIAGVSNNSEKGGRRSQGRRLWWVGPGCQRVRGEKGIPLRVSPGWVVGRLRDWAEWLPWGLFLIFFSFLPFLFYFLNSFISFAKMLQIKSNHFLNSSNIPCNAPNQ
jgi:hypothetical protein